MSKPKYATLKALIKAVQSGKEDPSKIRVWVDNDCVNAVDESKEPEDEDEGYPRIWDQDLGPESTVIELFKALGFKAQRV